ncbi:MAG: von Willebrand factor type A domain-containing protein [Arcicella sp.]|nr:von Willebrand factor type A domain-containing protein [Arcicella sp.]
MKAKIFIFIALIISVLANAQERTITGKVTDETGQGLPGISISVKGKARGTTCDLNGHYRIKSETNDILIFSFVGYESQEVKVEKSDVLDVKMKTSVKNLDELVISSNVLQGRVPGVIVGSKEAKIKIRGNAQADKVYGGNYAPMPAHAEYESNTEEYKPEKEIGFKATDKDPQTTFSIDVDRAAYTNVRRFIMQNGQLPPKDAVRIEEMVNYFDYNYAQPKGKDPINIETEISDSPWNKGLKILHIGLQAKTIATDKLPASNLVFLIDVSGSMNQSNKLPLVKTAFKLLTDQLREQDHVSIVVYAGAAGLVLPPTSGKEKNKIKDALENLSAGGSTAGGAGIELAYKTAMDNFVKGGNNRVILATDGDFNVGVSSNEGLEKLVENKRKSDIFLSVLGFGMGNYKDSKMETLSDKGNGNYAYIDNLLEAEKVFVKEFGGTLFTVAKDVKLQLEFNPKYVKAYRLIGYENRALANEDFKNDAKDAGEMGSGHNVTAIYEIIPAGIESTFLPDKLKYQQFSTTMAGVNSNEVCTIKIRYKQPDADKSIQMEEEVKDTHTAIEKTSENFRFSVAVVEFGLLLRGSDFKGAANYEQVIDLAKTSIGKDSEGYRAEFLKLVKTAKLLDKTSERLVVKE